MGLHDVLSLSLSVERWGCRCLFAPLGASGRGAAPGLGSEDLEVQDVVLVFWSAPAVETHHDFVMKLVLRFELKGLRPRRKKGQLDANCPNSKASEPLKSSGRAGHQVSVQIPGQHVRLGGVLV